MVFCQNKKGFTVIEILIVTIIITLTLGLFLYFWNTLDIFRRSRDSKRMNDLYLIDSVLKSLLATEENVYLGEENIVYISLPDTTSTCSSYNLPSLPAGYSYRCQTVDNYLKIDGNGWIPVNFTSSKILHLTKLPVDPINNQNYFYSYQIGGKKYKLAVKLESSSNFSRMTNDGGEDPNLYEIFAVLPEKN